MTGRPRFTKETIMKRCIAPLVIPALFFAICALAAPAPDIPIGDSPTFGPADAPVTIIEFIDFQ